MKPFLHCSEQSLFVIVFLASFATSYDELDEIKRQRRNVFAAKQDPNERHIVAGEEKAASNGSTGSPQRPRFNKLSRNTMISFDPFLYKCKEKDSVHCQNLTDKFRHRIVNEFKKSMAESKTANYLIDKTTNFYNVQNHVKQPNGEIQNPICALLRANVRCLKRSYGAESNGVFSVLPTQPLFEGGPDARQKQSCAIISSAGSMAKSGLGRFIGNFAKNKNSKHVIYILNYSCYNLYVNNF